MAPAVPKKGGGAPGEVRADVMSADPETVKQMLGALAKLQRKMIAASDWVGDRFADEARAIHLGEADARSIHGRATRSDAESLADEGIPIAPLLFPVTAPGEAN